MADAVTAALLRDRYGMPWGRFLEHLRTTPPGRVLELGSRGEQGTMYRDALPPGWTYTGFDIEPGHNVDVVGDAHELSRHVEPESFDALLSVATFEHLAMPWKVAVEINKVLKPGGVAVLSVPNEALINRAKALVRRFGLWRLVMRGADYDMPERMDDEWHLHTFDLAAFRALVPPALTMTRVIGVPTRALALRWVMRCESRA